MCFGEEVGEWEAGFAGAAGEEDGHCLECVEGGWCEESGVMDVVMG